MTVTAFSRRRRELAAAAVTQPEAPKGPKPLDRMNKAELQAKAAELGLALDDALTKAQMHDAIEAELARHMSAAHAQTQASTQPPLPNDPQGDTQDQP